ncbi:MAG: hypothetical protein M1827_005784 [Pycnora praestabilis]|nr:MAG: hypothetical protein M1827_005784 [Pycnora praestabilis]
MRLNTIVSGVAISFSISLSTVSATPVVSIANDVTIVGSSANGVEQFQNVPYGQDTSGANRFAPPKPIVLATGTTIQATASGAACPQAMDPLPGINGLFANVTNESEDCLNLRIARPAGISADADLPVFVWIYGGAYQLGNIYDPLYEPTAFVEQSVANGLPVIFVSMQYRNSIFGFAASDALQAQKSENVGLRDQRLALQWVQDNICQFGGNPGNVTLAAQAAGAFSLGLQLTAFGGTQPGLFHRAIAESGSAGSDQGIAANVSAQFFQDVATQLNCTSNNASSAVLACMRAVPLQKLLSTNVAFIDTVRPPSGLNSFIPTVDGDFIPDAPSTLVAEGKIQPLDSLIQGWNDADGTTFTSPTIRNASGVAGFLQTQWPGLTNTSLQQLIAQYPVTEFFPYQNTTPSFYQAARIFRDLTFTCPGLRMGEAYGNKGSDVYFYTLNQTVLTPLFDNAKLTMVEAYGASHFSDIPYVFKDVTYLNPNATASDFQLEGQVSGSWSTYTNTGNPVGAVNTTTLNSWPEAFSVQSNGTVAIVRVIGGPQSGPANLTTGDGPSLFAQEKIWSRCNFIQTIQSELQV